MYITVYVFKNICHIYWYILLYLTVCISIWAVFFLFLSGGLLTFSVWSQDSRPLTSQQSARIFSVKSLPRNAAWCNDAEWMRHFNRNIGGKGPSEFHLDKCEHKFTFHFHWIFSAITWERMAVNKILLQYIKSLSNNNKILILTIKHWIHLIYNQVSPSSNFPLCRTWLSSMAPSSCPMSYEICFKQVLFVGIC